MRTNSLVFMIEPSLPVTDIGDEQSITIKCHQ